VEEGTLETSLLKLSARTDEPQKKGLAKELSVSGISSMLGISFLVALLIGFTCHFTTTSETQQAPDLFPPPPLYRIYASSHYDAGLQHGRLARERIRGWFNVVEMKHRYKWASQAGSATFAQLKQDNEKVFPAYVQELQGIADGAGVTMDQIWVANLINEIDARLSQEDKANFVLPWSMQHCSDEYGVSSKGYEAGFAHGHNDDWSVEAGPYLYWLAISPSPGAKEIVSRCAGLTYPGTLVGWAPTWNAHGMFFTQNTLLPKLTSPGGLGVVFTQKRAICDSTSIDEAIASLKQPGWSSGASLNFVDLRNKRMANMEVWMNMNSVLEITNEMGNYSHFNVYKHLRTPSGARIDDPTAHGLDPRQSRSYALPPVANTDDIRMRMSDPLIYRTNKTLLTTILNGTTGTLDVWCCGVRATSAPPHYSWSLHSFFAIPMESAASAPTVR